MQTMRPSSSFSEPSAEFINCVLDQGAAKLNGVVGINVWDAFADGVPTNAELLAKAIPAAGQLLDLLGEAESGKVKVSSIDVTKTPIHIDSVARLGLSVLIPVAGGDGFFEANDAPWPIEQRSPNYNTRYGVGDIMMIRQEVYTFNGRRVFLPQTYHRGTSNYARHLLVVDTNNPYVSVRSTE